MPRPRLAADRRQPGRTDHPSLTKRQRRRRLMDEHDWKCAICGLDIPDIEWDAEAHQPDYGTIDHIVPWSVSHDDSWCNLQAAHLACNVRKRAETSTPCHPMT